MNPLTNESLQFLRDLVKNNNRDWFHQNKKRYEKDLKIPFQEFVGEIITGLQKFDPDIQLSPKDAIFRINRDIRFSKDKSPYKTHVGALVSAKGRKDKGYPGYYIHLEPGALMIGGGAYFLEKIPLEAIRSHMVQGPKSFEKLLKAKAFKDKFGEIKGEKNKRLPKAFAKAAETQPLLFHKQFYYMAELEPETATREKAVKEVLAYLKVGKKVNDFLIDAIHRKE